MRLYRTLHQPLPFVNACVCALATVLLLAPCPARAEEAVLAGEAPAAEELVSEETCGEATVPDGAAIAGPEDASEDDVSSAGEEASGREDGAMLAPVDEAPHSADEPSLPDTTVEPLAQEMEPSPEDPSDDEPSAVATEDEAPEALCAEGVVPAAADPATDEESALAVAALDTEATEPDFAPAKAAPEQTASTAPTTRVSLAGATIAPIYAQRYTGKKVKPRPTVTVDGKTLRRGIDYTLSYKHNKKLGRATVIIRGKGTYKGTRKVTFRIAKAVKVAKLKLGKVKKRTYTGSAIEPGVKLTYKGKRLVEGRDYTLAYKRNRKVGKATITIKGKGIYRGKRTVTFKIRPRSLKKAHLELVDRVPATGKKWRPKPTVVVAGRTLKRGRDYTLRYKNNRDIGTATVTITGKGGYKGSTLAHFEVVKRKSLAKAKLKTKTSGEKSVLVLKYGKKTLVEGVDYVVDRKVKKKTGMVKATITGIGFYEDVREKEYCEDAKRERLGKKLLKLCKSQLGVPYQRGATKWNELMDCSGLTYLVYQHAGIDIPRLQSYWAGGKNSQVYLVHSELKNWKKKIKDLVPGDIVFYGASWKKTDHVGIYAGDGMNYEAGPDEVVYRPVYEENWHPTWHSFIGGGSPV